MKGKKASTKGPDDLDDYGEDDEEYEEELADDETRIGRTMAHENLHQQPL